MAEHTGIEWCDATFNPWWGCEKVSPGCAHCYADTLSKRYAGGVQLWSDGHEFRFFGDKHWAAPLKWARLLPAKLGRRPRVFCASMADVFEERDELVAPRERLLDLIYETPELDWLLLTKRPEVMRDRYLAGGWKITPNLWLGTSIENSRFTWRADALREIPGAVRFISAEPLLGSLFERANDRRAANPTPDEAPFIRAPLNLDGIDWVIAGGESGPGARPTHPDWFRELRDACVSEWPTADLAHRPAFFFKQWGEWAPAGIGDVTNTRMTTAIDQHGRTRMPGLVRDGYAIVCRLVGGKRATGRHLDGRTWDEFPESKAAAVPA